MASRLRGKAPTLASLSETLVTIDSQGYITQINAEAQCLSGLDADQALGQPLTEVMPLLSLTERESLQPAIQAMLNSGGPDLPRSAMLAVDAHGGIPVALSGAAIRD